ncbi:kinase [Thraustotheca clavata]|uniref:Kinase n=1 Tax=Thraustotheca clavata TaxID=74557 RepID=A0A1V9Y6J8_9STRA|nr:kinase [Thraustotheca clavata]
MLLRVAVVVLLGILCAYGQETPCVYADLPSYFRYILVSGPMCANNMTICAVDANCSLTWSGSTRANIRNAQAIGSMKGYAGESLTITGSSVMLLNDMQLSSRMKKLEFIDTPLEIPPNLVWSKNLTSLTLTNTSMDKIPTNLPKGMLQFSFQENNLATLENLPRNLTTLSLARNDLTEIRNQNWTKLTQLTLGGNPLTTIDHVRLSRYNLRLFDCQGCNLTDFIVDEESFMALDQLSPRSMRVQNGVTLYFGFNMDGGNITSNETNCNNVGGSLREVWSIYEEITNNIYMVCVLPPEPSPTPSSATTKPIVTDKASSSDVITIPIQTILSTPAPGTAQVQDLVSVGLVAGGALTSLCCVGLLLFCMNRRRFATDSELWTLNNSRSTQSSYDTLTQSQYTQLDLSGIQLYRLDNAAVIPKKLLASGAFADVYMGEYKGEPVAIKKLLGHRVSISEVQSLVDEIKLISSFNCPYIVRCIGACWEQPSDMKCVLEYMNGGDLRDYLQKYNANQFPWSAKLDIIVSIIEALMYLHSLPVIHRDLKSRNILLDTVKGAKLTDFGVSKEDTQATMTVGVGTYRWMAPEILQFNHYSTAADIYSFGMLLSEFDTHDIPYANMKNEKTGNPLIDTAIMGMVIAGTVKPTFSDSMPDWLRDLAIQSIETDPEDRPTAMELTFIIRKRMKQK